MSDIFTQPSRDPIGDAILFVEEAIDALTLESGVRIDTRTGKETPLSALELCASEELARMDRSLRSAPNAPTVLDFYAKEWKRALVAIVSAQNALKAARR